MKPLLVNMYEQQVGGFGKMSEAIEWLNWEDFHNAADIAIIDLYDEVHYKISEEEKKFILIAKPSDDEMLVGIEKQDEVVNPAESKRVMDVFRKAMDKLDYKYVGLEDFKGIMGLKFKKR